MGELEVRQQIYNDLVADKDAAIKQLNEAMSQREQWDTIAKNHAGAIKLLESQIVKAKLDMDNIKEK